MSRAKWNLGRSGIWTILARFSIARHDSGMSDDTGLFETALTEALTRWNMSITADQLGKLRAHFDALVDTNRTMNLTRITEPAAAAVKHYADSLALIKWARERDIDVQTVLDVGTGAGFPAVPLAVMRPHWSVTAIDGTRKKIDFVRRVVADTGLENLRCEHAHSTQWKERAGTGSTVAPGFQLVVFRALATLPKALAQTVCHSRPNGYLVSYGTPVIDATDQNLVEESALEMGIHLCEQFTYDLDLAGQTQRRVLHVFRRTSARQ